jgi:uncharacterized BrkB/YihY/UPF0761 family membrane protein
MDNAKKLFSIFISIVCIVSILIINLTVTLFGVGDGNFASLSPQMSNMWFQAVEVLPFASAIGIVFSSTFFKQPDQKKWKLFTLICSGAGLVAFFVLVVEFTRR